MIDTLDAEELGPLGARLLQVLDLAEPAIGERTGDLAGTTQAIAANVRAAPVAGDTAMQVPQIGERLPSDQALTLESLAHSALLGGGELVRWRIARAGRSSP